MVKEEQTKRERERKTDNAMVSFRGMAGLGVVATTARTFRSGREGRRVEGRNDTLLELRRYPAMKQDKGLDQGRGTNAGEAAESLKDLLVEGARVLDVVEQLMQLKIVADGFVDGAGE